MGESLCRIDKEVELHLTVPEAPVSVRAWAERKSAVVLSTSRPEGVSGWDVKPWLLLQKLNAGHAEALWLDADMIVMRPVSLLVKEFPRDSLLVAEEWNRPGASRVATREWGLPSLRPVRVTNSCFVRATQAHRPLLVRWLQMTQDPRYREAQARPFELRPWHLSGDQMLLTALLGSEDFGRLRFDAIQMGRHIAQCAGSSGYSPLNRCLDLFRGLPPLIHCIGRKPWTSSDAAGGIQQFLMHLASDVSPYVLASRRVAKTLSVPPGWVEARTSLGVLLRGLTANHPGMAGLPLAILHALQQRISQTIATLNRRKE
jgi:hypothetical protein